MLEVSAPSEKTGVLIAQLGTPSAPSMEAVRAYLWEFLTDPHVVPKNGVVWRLILKHIILRKYAAKSAARYQKIWQAEGSPLQVITADLAQALNLRAAGANMEVSYGMRYGEPSLAHALDELLARGAGRILIIPMFPQYCSATSASVVDAVAAHLQKLPKAPPWRAVESFHLRPEYISILAARINACLAKQSPPPERLILSYHGLPQSFIDKGDPYARMCEETSRALAPQLQIPPAQVSHCYQSRFGRGKWLAPGTAETVMELAGRGVKRIVVACPSFTADCLETLEEIGHELKTLFLSRGGMALQVVPALNAGADWVEGLGAIIRAEIGES